MTFDDLKNLISETVESVQTRIKEYAEQAGAEPTAWGPRSFPAVMTYALASTLQYLYQLIGWFASSAEFSENSEDDVADLWAESQFGLTRTGAVQAEFDVLLTLDADAQSQNLDSSFRVGTSWGVEYYLRDSTTILPGESLTERFIAVEAGTEANVAPSSINQAVSPIIGLSVLGQSQAVLGTEEESTSDLYARCLAQWGGIGAASSEFVQDLCRDLDAKLTKVVTRVDSTTIGQMHIYLAQDGETATSEQVAEVEDKIAELSLFQAVDVQVAAATTENYVLTGYVYCQPGQLEAAQAHVAQQIVLWQKEVTYGETIHKSDAWRLFQADELIDWVSPGWQETTFDQWTLPVIEDQLTYVETA